MRTYETPYISDWFVISLRWLTIVGLSISLAAAFPLDNLHYLLLGILIAWNLGLTYLAGFNRRLQNHRKVSLLVDMGFAVLLFWMFGGVNSPIFWVVILPIFTLIVNGFPIGFASAPFDPFWAERHPRRV